MRGIVWIEDRVEIGENSVMQITGGLSAEAGKTEDPAEIAENTVNILRILYDQIFFCVMSFIIALHQGPSLRVSVSAVPFVYFFKECHNHSGNPTYNRSCGMPGRQFIEIKMLQFLSYL